MTQHFSFDLLRTNAHCAARRGTLRTAHGAVDTPAFMPVGTLAAVKGLTIDMVRETGAQMLLANTYHLALRPGEDVVAELGGLHAFMGWNGPILTDSGGFQLVSLAQMTKVTEDAATFRSHIDGTLLSLSPERAVQIQEALGSDIAMVLDHVVGLPAPEDKLRDAVERTLRWARRCQQAHSRGDQALFAIVQGGLDVELRQECSGRLAEMNFPGYAIGGLSVGEDPADMQRLVAQTACFLPPEKPRYLMGVGRPEDLLHAVEHGVDMFDCVLPTRNGRNALAFTDEGPLRIKNLKYQRDARPLEADCPCPACRHSRAYLRHLFMANEMLGPVLLSIHNVTYYQRLMAEMRQAIEQDRFVELRTEKTDRWNFLAVPRG